MLKDGVGKKVDNRIKWIDCVRALGIVSIVIGHTLGQFHGGPVYQWLYLFHVPLCIMLSGYLFKDKDDLFQTWRYIKKVLIRDYIPYIFWGIVSIAIYIIVIDRSNFATNIGGYFRGLLYANGSLGRSEVSSGLMVWNTPLWYLPCLISIEIVASILGVIKIRYKEETCLVLSIVIACVCYRYFKLHTLFMEFESAIYLMPFFCAGKVLCSYSGYLYSKLRKMKFSTYMYLIMIIAGSAIGFFNGVPGYLSDGYGRSYALFALSAMVICLGIIGTVVGLQIKLGKLEYIGKRTLSILVMHKFPIMLFSILVTKVLKISINNYFLELVVCLCGAGVTVVCCLIGDMIIDRICPVLVGKQRKR